MSPAVQAGKEIRDFIDQKRLDLGLSGEDMLGLLLTVAYGFAESELYREECSRKIRLFAERMWGMLSRVQRIQVVDHLRVGKDGGLR